MENMIPYHARIFHSVFYASIKTVGLLSEPDFNVQKKLIDEELIKFKSDNENYKNLTNLTLEEVAMLAIETGYKISINLPDITYYEDDDDTEKEVKFECKYCAEDNKLGLLTLKTKTKRTSVYICDKCGKETKFKR